MFFNAHSTKSTSCYDCPISYNGVYADSHSALDAETGKELQGDPKQVTGLPEPLVLSYVDGFQNAFSHLTT